ncbi:UDP-N-acetylmuramate--L-alanine ligase [bacterium]|nr:UDP-N-acetylmuramate--L-alanine ligase [bacterium]
MEISKKDVIHFIGIGGVGMSAIARILLKLGYKVSGSDLRESVNTIRLKDLGAKIFYKQIPSNLRSAAVVVVSTAIRADNLELQEAYNLNLKVFRRAEMLDFLMRKYEKRIAVTGTHGKTTTSSMLACVFSGEKTAPTYLVGSDLNDYKSNAELGDGPYFIAEADESDGSFLMLDSNIGVITNMEKEHMNYYKTEENLKVHFRKFMAKVLANKGYLVINKDDSRLMALARDFDHQKILFYALEGEAFVSAQDIEAGEDGISYNLKIEGREDIKVNLKVYGNHNVSNSLAAIAVGVREGLDVEKIISRLEKFSGTKRRMQLIGDVNKIKIFDDYAHHPTEISTTLKGLKKSFKGRVICVFQPHRYTRTQNLFAKFVTAFEHADKLILTEIYAADEDRIAKVSGKLLSEEIEKQGRTMVEFVEQKGEISSRLMPQLRSGDIVIFMGAGDIYTVAKDLFLLLKKKFKISS